MGNTIPITSPPRPSPSRAVIFLEPQCIGSYLREPWRKPVGKLQIVGPSNDELPPALDGVVPLEVYREMVQAVADRAVNYRGGLINIVLAMFQACLALVVMLGFFLARYLNFDFFNPITLGVLGTLELLVVSQSGRLFQREENELSRQLLEVVRPWRVEYGIFAKIRKTRGQIGEDRERTKSSTFYCLVLEKMGTGHDADTVSLSTMDEMDSDVESQV